MPMKDQISGIESGREECLMLIILTSLEGAIKYIILYFKIISSLTVSIPVSGTILPILGTCGSISTASRIALITKSA